MKKRILFVNAIPNEHSARLVGDNIDALVNEAMKKLHDAGFKTWASIEPIIDIPHSKLMIEKSAGFCHLYKIGLESGKSYNNQELRDFITWCVNGSTLPTEMKFYFKDSLLKVTGISRDKLPDNCVERDFNIFNQ